MNYVMFTTRSLAAGAGVRGCEPDEADGVDLLRCVHRALRCGVRLRPTKEDTGGETAAGWVGLGWV